MKQLVIFYALRFFLHPCLWEHVVNKTRFLNNWLKLSVLKIYKHVTRFTTSPDFEIVYCIRTKPKHYFILCNFFNSRNWYSIYNFIQIIINLRRLLIMRQRICKVVVYRHLVSVVAYEDGDRWEISLPTRNNAACWIQLSLLLCIKKPVAYSGTF